VSGTEYDYLGQGDQSTFTYFTCYKKIEIYRSSTEYDIQITPTIK